MLNSTVRRPSVLPIFVLAVAMAAGGALAAEPSPAEQPANGRRAAVCVVILGDSTVCNYPDDSPTRGWGQYVQEYFNDSVRVVNMAKSGRSTKTFIAEGLWKKSLDEKPDYVLIQFGHNDSHAPDRPEATDAATDYTENLRRYVDEARAIGARPVLVTPMHRRTFDDEGRLADILQPYADAMKRVAAEKNVPLVDLHATSGRLFQKLGPVKCQELANKPDDRTHFNERGARAMAAMVMERLPEVEPSLASLMK